MHVIVLYNLAKNFIMSKYGILNCEVIVLDEQYLIPKW